MFRVINKRKKYVLIIVCIFAIVLVALQIINIYKTNKKAFHQVTEVYHIGEFVEYDNNFLLVSNEKATGYSIRVNQTALMDYSEFLKGYGITVSQDNEWPTPKYICLVNVTIKNEGNSEGYINTLALSLFNQSLQLPLDFEVWNIIDKSVNGNTILKLRENTEVTLDLPFVAQAVDEAVNTSGLNHRIENETFNFMVCDFPVRKLIEIHF